MLGLYYTKVLPFIRFLKVFGGSGGDDIDNGYNAEEPKTEVANLNITKSDSTIGNMFKNEKQNKIKNEKRLVKSLVNGVFNDQNNVAKSIERENEHKDEEELLLQYNENRKERRGMKMVNINVADSSQMNGNRSRSVPVLTPLSMSLVNKMDVVNLNTKRMTAPCPCPSPLSTLNKVVLDKICLCTELQLPFRFPDGPDFNATSELYQYQHVYELGKGSFGTVSLVRHQHTNKKFALKTIDLKRILRDSASEVTSAKDHALFLKDLVLGLRREIKLLHKFRACPYITKLCHTFVCDETKLVYLCFEDVCDTPLEYFVENGRSLSFEELQAVAVSMLCALRELHDVDVVHLDVKPGNILINKAGQVKLCDFGAAVEISHAPERVRYTKIYASPEYFFQGVDPLSSTLQRHEESIEMKTNFWDSPTLKKSDIWSLGITLLELSIATSPFRDLYEEVDPVEAQRNINRLYCEYRKTALGLSTQLTTDSLLISLLKEPHLVCRKMVAVKKDLSSSSAKDDKNFEIRKAICSKLFSESALDSAEITYSFIDFLERCLRFDVENRASITDLCLSHYFVEVFDNPCFRHNGNGNRERDSTPQEAKIDYDVSLHFDAIRNLLSWKTKYNNRK